jgi:hypothetical protein
MEKETLIDDIVALLDNSVSKGTNHLNIAVESTNDLEQLKQSINTLSSTDCTSGNLACRIPNLTEGIEDNNSNTVDK